MAGTTRFTTNMYSTLRLLLVVAVLSKFSSHRISLHCLQQFAPTVASTDIAA